MLIGERVDLRVDRAETVRELVRLLKSWHDESDEAEQIAAQRNEVFVRKPLSGSRVGFVSSGEAASLRRMQCVRLSKQACNCNLH